MTELKPCPFCGKMPKFIIHSIDYNYGVTYIKTSISCTECGTAKLGTGHIGRRIQNDMSVVDFINTTNDAIEDAVLKWNRRV